MKTLEIIVLSVLIIAGISIYLGHRASGLSINVQAPDFSAPNIVTHLDKLVYEKVEQTEK